jgi:hypothetical protein
MLLDLFENDILWSSQRLDVIAVNPVDGEVYVTRANLTAVPELWRSFLFLGGEMFLHFSDVPLLTKLVQSKYLLIN